MTTPHRLLACLLLAFTGCVTDYKLVDSNDGNDGGEPSGDGDGNAGHGNGMAGNGGTGGAGAGGVAGNNGCTGTCANPLPCQRGGLCSELATTPIYRLDLLFMVDNSNSMREEQVSLRAQLPKLINVLTSGDQTGDGIQDFAPARDLHLGVVSSDMGLPGVPGIDGCVGLGDDGMLRSQASPDVMGCSTTNFNPPFLAYNRDNGDSAGQLATDFSCISTLGATGCGFQQQLESTLKAVWPGSDSQVRFVTNPQTGFGATGQAGPGFPNGDFIRQDSLIGLVIVTDEEDCSSSNMAHFVPSASTTGLNTRCFFESQRPEPNNLFDVERYIEAFKALRPGREDQVIFSAIVGVPPELVTPEQLSLVDFGNATQRNAFFDGLLAAPAMQEVLDPRGNDDPADDNLAPSCDRQSANGESARAFPPRRIVQVAKGFGANGLVQSICQEDFGPAIDAIIERLARRLGGPCLASAVQRESDGTIACNVIWELLGNPTDGSPTECNQREFLSALPGTGPSGGKLCRVHQLAVGGMPTAPILSGGLDGFYYDDFSDDTRLECTGGSRIAYSPEAQPPTGVRAYLDCE